MTPELQGYLMFFGGIAVLGIIGLIIVLNLAQTPPSSLDGQLASFCLLMIFIGGGALILRYFVYAFQLGFYGKSL